MKRRYFFFSYAREDAGAEGYVDRLFDDLVDELAPHTALPRDQVGFKDTASIDLGQRWTEELSDALRSARAFVALYSPSYFASEYCGKEWAAFRRRFHRQYPGEGEPPLLFPVLWVPAQASWLPACAAAVQFSDPEQPDPYREEGLRALLKYGDEEVYRRFLRRFVRVVLKGAERHELAEHPTELDFERLPNAFEEPAGVPVGKRERLLRGPLRQYLGRLWGTSSPLPLVAISEGKAGREEIPLSAVYTALEVTATVGGGSDEVLEVEGRSVRSAPVIGLRMEADYRDALFARVRAEAERDDGEQRRRALESDRGGPGTRRITALEAAAGVPRLVLLGDPGSGKSTFCRILALSLAGQILGKEKANLERLEGREGVEREEGATPGGRRWPHGALVPIFVELRRFAASEEFPGDGETPEAEDLLAFIAAEAGGALTGGHLDFLREQLSAERPGVLLLLDGLDEISGGADVRQRLQAVIASWCRQFPSCRVLVTSRPYAYRDDSPWRLDGSGFEEATLAPFDGEAIETFLRFWFTHLKTRHQVEPEVADRRHRDLLHALRTDSYLRPLAERPLMLTMMADLQASQAGALGGGRAELYERSTRLLLDRWNEERGLGGISTVSGKLRVPVKVLRDGLEELACRVHGERGGGEAGAAEITSGEVWEALDAHLPEERKVSEGELIRYLQNRAGILLEVGKDEAGGAGKVATARYRFPHRSFQEFLAACHLARVGFPGELVRRVREDPDLWREVFLLAAARVAENPYTVWAPLKGLVPEEPSVEAVADDDRFRLALLAGMAVRESRLHEGIEEGYAGDLEKIRAWLERCVELGALEPGERAESGRVLGLLGDRRRGVGVKAGAGGDDVPEVEWHRVEAGPFEMGSGKGDEGGLPDERPRHAPPALPAFDIARYPITNVQYQAFVDDDGYREKHRDCWTDAGWAWKGERWAPEEVPEPFGLPNHPRVAVTWHEAWAFSRWLGEKLGRAVRLPTEAEWERAARGTDGRIWPWEGDFEEDRCNSAEAGIGTTTAVGSFPGGQAPSGALDLAGNVLEWTSSAFDPYPYDPEDGREKVDRDSARVCRGGSSILSRRRVRCASRYGFPPVSRNWYLGFRVVSPVESLPSDPSDL